MRIYPAIHYTMGGLWVDYNLMTTVPGCFALGEANFSDHGANRLGQASALMQGLSDGYFVIPYTIGDYLANTGAGAISPDSPEVKQALEKVRCRVDQLTSTNGKRSSRSYHKELGQIMWEFAGMARNEKGLKKAIGDIQDLRDDFSQECSCCFTGSNETLNAELEREVFGRRYGTFLNSENFYVLMLSKEGNLAVGIFGRNIKLPTVRPLAMTKTLLMPLFGNTKARARHLNAIRKN